MTGKDHPIARFVLTVEWPDRAPTTAELLALSDMATLLAKQWPHTSAVVSMVEFPTQGVC